LGAIGRFQVELRARYLETTELAARITVSSTLNGCGLEKALRSAAASATSPRNSAPPMIFSLGQLGTGGSVLFAVQ
jgi:hypothetical protein